MEMDGIRWVRNKKAWKQLNQEPDVIGLISQVAERTAAKAGPGFVALEPTRTRRYGVARQAVLAASTVAARSQAKYHILEKALR